MSSFIGGRSGNRGMCAQPCRQKYKVGKKEGYFLSPRDLCHANELERMIDAGITSFKIEGRMKRPEYVAVVTQTYRKYLDSLAPLSVEDEIRLKKIFVRGDGFTKGYFDERNTPEIMNYTISNDNVSERADQQLVKETANLLREGVENKKIPVNAVLTVKNAEPSRLLLTDGIHTVVAEGAAGELAKNIPLTQERAQMQIGKLGQTPFVLHNFTFYADEDVTLPVSALNLIRREAAERLMEERAQFAPRKIYPYEYAIRKSDNNFKPYVAVQVRTVEQFAAAREAERVIVPISMWNSIVPDHRCAVLLPQVVLDEVKTEKLLSQIPDIYAVYASSHGMIQLAKKMGRKVVADWSANIYNSVTANSFAKDCCGVTLSPELSLTAIREITSSVKIPCEVIGYGYQTVMISRACLIRGITGKCDCSMSVAVTDKTGAQFTILGDRETHLNTVLNSRPTFMADKVKDIYKCGVGGIRLVFTTENGKETENIINMYLGKTPIVKPPVYTRGHFMKKDGINQKNT